MPTENEPLAGDLGRAVELLAEAFAARSIRYALIGGLATLLHGRPRFTQDVDILLDVPQLALPGLLEELAQRGFTFDRDTVIREYVQEHMTSLAFGTVRIDWLKPVLPLYARALQGATELSWTEGRSLKVASPEGLILTKLVSFRPQDQEDIRVLLIANRDEIDLDLIRREWSAVHGEESRTAWLEDTIAALAKCDR
ncbi:MAG: nucleotidyl transferase AbiEii/AbiGii toxin family protein [Planctomycetales bacterium]